MHYDLRNEDIQGSKPQSHKFVTTRSPTNPLNPEYKLAQVEIRVATPPKFIRDNIDIKVTELTVFNRLTSLRILMGLDLIHIQDTIFREKQITSRILMELSLRKNGS